MNSLFPQSFTKFYWWQQIIYGLIGGVINCLLNLFMRNVLVLPIFMDTIFTVACSFISVWSGLIAAFTYHLLEAVIEHDFLNMLFMICSFLVVLIIRCTVRRCEKTGVRFINLIAATVIMILTMALVGGTCYFFLYGRTEYVEDNQMNVFTGALVMHDIPLLASAIFARIPVNFIDKFISVFAGFFIAAGINRSTENFRKNR